MSGSIAQRDRERLYVNLSTLETLSDYARRPTPTVPAPLLPGLDETGQRFLGTPPVKERSRPGRRRR